MKLGTALVALVIVGGGLVALTGGLSNREAGKPTPDSETSASNQTLIAKQRAERDEKFTRERADIITKAKKLADARDYRGVISMGEEYAWAHDPDLEPLIAAARIKVAATAAPPEPADWREVSRSTAPADKKLVSEITKMKWWDACIAWGREMRKPTETRRAKALTFYLASERMLSPADLGHVSDKTLDIGMTECGLLAVKGMPGGGANHTTTAFGTTSQYVYGSRTYVYTEPSREYSVGVVRAIQH